MVCTDCWTQRLILNLPEKILQDTIATMARNEPLAILELPEDSRLFTPIKRVTDGGPIEAALAACLWIARYRPRALRSIETSGMNELRPLCHKFLAEIESGPWPSETVVLAKQCLKFFVGWNTRELKDLAEMSEAVKEIAEIAQALAARLKEKLARAPLP